MIDFPTLQAVAFKTELAAARRLSARTGMPEADALQRILTQSAGVAGLAALLVERQAQRRHAELQAARRQAQAAAARSRGAGSSSSAWRAWFDGSARPNPGRCGLGSVLEGPAGERIELSLDGGHGNSSEAEYRALIAALRAAIAHGATDLTVQGDSQVVVDDVNGPDCASAPALRLLRDEALALLGQLPQARLRWIPRHKNTRADALSQRAVQSFTMEQEA
ncbi:ribonuclease HI family protein [Telluria beijingensis]|uniref:ribonuclease HI family protein n=1 Tax=Telluria beijingensis TaxID=3068633 RepID=UPI002795720C|nr:ribonuclease HI family protein [Massilia sp. REN29]